MSDPEISEVTALTQALLYTLTFGFCMYKTNKFNYFDREWKHTKLFYISVLVQTFIRMTTYSLLAFAIPKNDRNLSYISVMRSVPDTLFYINYLLLAYQTMNIFYHSHIDNDVRVTFLLHFTRPKFRKARKIIWLLIIAWLGTMGLIYALLITNKINNEFIDTGFTIVNLLSGTFVLLFLMYLHAKYSETPFKTQQDRLNLRILSGVLMIWTMGRYFKGFLGVLVLDPKSIIAIFIYKNSTEIGKFILKICLSLISEVLCFYVVMDPRFINIFIYQDQANMKKGDISSELSPLTTSDDSANFRSTIIENFEVEVLGPYKKRAKGFGEIFIANLKSRRVLYRKLSFSRVSGYILEDIKLEIEEMAQLKFSGLVTFHGAVINLPEISLITSEMPKSLYKYLHEDKVIMSLKDKITLISNICRLGKRLHGLGLYHGHLSSHNIMLKEGNKPLISDLGFEKLKKYAGIMLNYTNKNPWSSPEVLFDTGATVSKPKPSDDVYSIGVIIWEIVTGNIPFEDTDEKDLRDNVVSKGLTPKVAAYFPKDLVKVLKMCWATVDKRAGIDNVYDRVSKMKLMMD